MLAASVSHHTHPARDALLQTFFAPAQFPGAAGAHDLVRLQDLPPPAQRAASASLDDPGDADDAPEWTEEDVVHLHWRLLLELRRLADPETPLEEKLDTLAWALTDPSLDGRPFSFASCLRVVGTSPMSPTPYFGLIREQPDWVARQLARNPQWVNEQIKAREATPQADLFGSCDGALQNRYAS
jgi:hypothetical protein